MNKKTLFLFTEQFPYIGGEAFLETEIRYLASRFDNVFVFPAIIGEHYYGLLPDNVSVKQLDEFPQPRLRKLIFRYFGNIIYYFGIGFLTSKNRSKYISQFFFSWNFLMGILKRTHQIEQSGIIQNQEAVFYTYWFSEWASSLAVCKKRNKIERLITRAHGYDYDELQNGRGWFPFREVEIKNVDKVVQISSYGLNKMKMQYPKAHLLLNRLGIEDQGFGPVLPLADAVFRIVSCSSFVALKRIPLLIDVLSELKVEFYWVHFGGGEGMEAMQAYAHSKLKPTDFTFKGQVANSEVIAYYKNNPVDLFVNMSELEGIPVSLMEAISFGIPIAGCNVCGMPEIVTSATGLLLDKSPDVGKTAVMISAFLQKKSRDLETRKGVKAFWKNHFNAKENYPRFLEMLENECL